MALLAASNARAQTVAHGPSESAVCRAVLDHVLGTARDTLFLRDLPARPRTLRYYLGNEGEIPPEFGAALLRATLSPRRASSMPVDRPVRVVPNRKAIEFAERKRVKVLALSPVIISGDRALIEYSFTCGVLCGRSALLLLTRAADGSWHVTQEVTQVVS